MCETGPDNAMLHENTRPPSEGEIARMFKENLGVEINPQALRMFIRSRWVELALLAHRIHDGKK